MPDLAIPETQGNYRLRVLADFNDYVFVEYRNETLNSSKGDLSGRDCSGNENVGTNCRISSLSTPVEGKPHDIDARNNVKNGHIDQDYDVYKIFLRRGAAYKACINSAPSDDGWVSLWVTGLGNYSSAFKVYRPGGRGVIPQSWWVSTRPVCTNVNPKVTGPHWLHAKVGAIHTVDSFDNSRHLVANTALGDYWVYYEER